MRIPMPPMRKWFTLNKPELKPLKPNIKPEDVLVNIEELKKHTLEMLMFGTSAYTTDKEGRIKHIPMENIIMEYKLTKETLYDVCVPVTKEDNLTELIENMRRIMYEGRGVGLAANQIGSNKRVIIINVGKFRKVILNPVITEFSILKKVKSVEGCLSFPNKKATVMRYKTVTIEGFSPNWKPIKQKLKGLASICAQHEVDHLFGFNWEKKLTKEGE